MEESIGIVDRVEKEGTEHIRPVLKRGEENAETGLVLAANLPEFSNDLDCFRWLSVPLVKSG